jgi:hypothetical protein
LAETFSYAESFDESLNRYVGLRCGEAVRLSRDDGHGLLVKSEWAQLQREEEETKRQISQGATGASAVGPNVTGQPLQGTAPPTTAATPTQHHPRRFHGTVTLDPTRPGRDAGRIANEVIAHLVGLVGARVTLTLEIEAEVPDSVPENVVRSVTENSNTLKFTSQGFERE